LPKKPNEDKELYELRVAKLAYTPLMSSIVSRYLSKMSSGVVKFDGSVPGEIELFRMSNQKPGDRKRDEKGLLGEIFLHVLKYGSVWLEVSTPTSSLPASLYEEQMMVADGYSPYVCFLEPLAVINWSEPGSEDKWHITRKWLTENRPFEQPKTILCWTLYTTNEIVEYRAEVKAVQEHDDMGNKCTTVTHVLVGTEWLSVRDERAVVPVYSVVETNGYYNYVHVCVDDGWLCKQLFSKQIQHLQVESAWTDTAYLAGTIQRVFTPLPPAPMADERVPMAVPDYQKELAQVGNNHILVASNYQFVESTGGAIGNQQSVLDKIESQIKEIAALHFASTSTSVLNQSGSSKAVDMSLLDDALQNYGVILLAIYNQVLEKVEYLTGGTSSEAGGLDDFSDLKLDTVVSLLQTLGSLPVVPAPQINVLIDKLLELAKVEAEPAETTVPVVVKPEAAK
jgi:hypothetical protein